MDPSKDDATKASDQFATKVFLMTFISVVLCVAATLPILI